MAEDDVVMAEGGDAAPAAAAADAAPAKVEVDVQDPMSLVREILKRSLAIGGLARGLHEVAKALDRRQALLCVLAGNCDEANYTKLVEALCREHSIPLVKVPEGKQLGEWAGLCKIDREGAARKVVGCSCVVVTQVDSEHDYLSKLLELCKQ
eukprot:c23353_g1_i1.p1 GENE.c23353_g1_i1~~c23353_g1_i1.p1  ORF type:complete len:152 (+),score=27.23 c23353_g1_i1:84-539(+)